MAPSALYRYFPSRDDLLTALIRDGYETMAAAARLAETQIPRNDLRERWLAVGHGVRGWALAHPAEYGLLYGNPIPGYSAPQDTVAPAAAVILMLAEIAAAARPAGALPPAPLPEPVRADMRRLIDEQGGGISEERLERVLAGWTHLLLRSPDGPDGRPRRPPRRHKAHLAPQPPPAHAHVAGRFRVVWLTAVHRSFWHASGTPMRRIGTVDITVQDSSDSTRTEG
jgi:AcrR family transcriptional regulator